MPDYKECNFSPLAELDLEEIADYIALDNPRRALSFIHELREKCQQIVIFPEAYPLRPELSEGIRIAPHERYVICYTVLPYEVRIERIIAGKRKLSALFN